MGNIILNFLTTGPNVDQVTQLTQVLTVWTLLFVGIAGFIQIKSYLELKSKIKAAAAEVATEIAKTKAAEALKEINWRLNKRIEISTDLTSEFTEHRGNAWRALINVLSQFIDDPSLSINQDKKEKLKKKLADTQEKILENSYVSSHLLQLFDRDSNRRGAARAYLRDHKITNAIRFLQLQLDSYELDDMTQEEKDDIINTIRIIESKK